MKIFNFLIMFALMCIMGTNVWALDQNDGVYQIGTAEDLVAFSDLVNGGEYGANAVLTADIDLSGVENFTPIGTHFTTPYVGVFNGQGHIISNLNIDLNVLAETGLFYRISGTVQNLGIMNATVKNPGGWRVGVIGGNCVGGTIENCFTAGDITLESGQKGGLCGLIQNSLIKSCYTTYEKIGDCEDGVAIDNCYWGTGVTNMAPTGELCYKMNGDQSTITWFQNLGEDVCPVLDNTHKQVYVIGDLRCDGTVLSGDISYTNDPDAASQIPPHNFVDGVCTVCGQADPGFVQIVDGWYEVSTPAQLVYISELVNGGNYDIKIRLTSDIDLSGISYFPPIGTLCWPGGPMLSYKGTFDGQGHIIYNLSIDKDVAGAETGLFGRLDGATIKNLGIVNATFKNPNALRAGVLAGCANASSITNCFTAGDFAMDELICTFDGRHGDGMCGLITAGSVITNCYTTYGTFGDPEASTLTNYYWGENANAMAPTGELCYKLNGDQSEIVWYQTLGEDPYPIFDPSHQIVIFEDGKYGNADGMEVVQSSEFRVHSDEAVYDLMGRKIVNSQMGNG